MYSISLLKDYNQERHIELNVAKSLIEENKLQLDKLTNAMDSKNIHVYEFNNKQYLDMLDIGRVYHQQPEKKKGLTIDRCFTDGKTDPFKTVGPYSERELEIKNSDGEIIFEMKDAVFPESWDDNDAKMVSQKYFYKPSKQEWKERLNNKIGSEYENSIVHLITRVSNFFADKGYEFGYFKTEADRDVFSDELKYLQINRMFAFNSPVQFNAGLFNEYDVEGSQGLNYHRDVETGEIEKIENGCNIHPQCHACFIKAPSDNLEDILMHSVHEGGIFSSGSGIGGDIGALRGEGEKLSGGGKSSGPMSFFKIYDDAAGSIKSGGKSRRAARMTTMRYTHPDIMDFIESKVKEDGKALTLMKNGYSPGMDGEAYSTVTYQNTNISIRLDDYFFEQLKNGGKIELRNIVDNKVVDEMPADQMLKELSFGSWRVGDPGVQYESLIQDMHTSKNSGRINSSNPCSEYMFLDDTSCNLASTNLLKFSDEIGKFNVEKYSKANKLISIALDIANDAASYPVESIARTSPEFRTIGLGYGNIGALLMRKGLAYDSDEGRNYAAAITALMTANAYEASVDMAENLGTFVHHEFNRVPMLEVMNKHKENLDDINWDNIQPDLKNAAYTAWKNVVKRGNDVGFRNAQATVLAPTGTISYLMGNDTTGIEPSLSLRYNKNLAGGGNITLINREVPHALENLGYNSAQIKDIEDHIKEENTVIGSPHISPEHYNVFDTAFGNIRGQGSISFEGHVSMLGATQPFISGAISKTNNMPESATVKDVYDGYILGHDLGLKALAIFRNNSKPISALSLDDKSYIELKRGEKEDLPNNREVFETEVKIGGSPLHVMVSEYPNGKPGQIVFLSYKSGSTLKALLETHGILASKSLSRGVSLDDVVSGWMGQQFDPQGFVQGHPSIKTALSPLDFAAKFLLLEYQGKKDFANDPDSVNMDELRGANNGSLFTYAREGIDDWDFEDVINDSLLGGFKQNGFPKKKTISFDNTTKEITYLAASINGNKGNGEAKELRNERGVPCKECGNIQIQTKANCYECTNCPTMSGGCG
ncbi:vitamin B12-dependent ribonucleotide reductase [Candidatus Woesearchaeota archaeon]|jgi:ribonucleoside-diphosphate reductase alpha chain|nr:vitamin B12-dependent ribonucleotide reductase [Candidatus Woesearchaeota archaeon]